MTDPAVTLIRYDTEYLAYAEKLTDGWLNLRTHGTTNREIRKRTKNVKTDLLRRCEGGGESMMGRRVGVNPGLSE